jgi:hypothetical protein
MRSKRVTKDSPFRGALWHDAACQLPNHGEGEVVITAVIESTSHKGGVQIYFNLAFLFCAVVIKMSG